MEDEFKIFIVEDNETYNKLLVHNASLNPDFTVKSYLSGNELLNALDEKPDVITLDYRLPDINGDDLLKKIKDYNPSIEVIIISEQNDIATAVDLLKKGAFDYVVKSPDIKERLHHIFNNIRSKTRLQREVQNLKNEVRGKYSFENSIIGKSPAMQRVFELIEKALTTNISVAITGETGTGKEVVAKAIHYNSYTHDRPFIAVNMAAIPSELVESELFGHEKGAFTGAISRRKGKFEEAADGTLFLDEICEMELNLQAKLLRVLQEREVTRLGGNSTVEIKCRIIVATNRKLIEEVEAGNFRQDLYYRLRGLPIHLPPLRDRGHDILILANHFKDEFCKENKLSDKHFSDEARKKLLSYQWPGNVRELKSVVELAIVMSSGDEIKDQDIDIGSNDILPNILNGDLTLREYNQRIIELYMKKNDNNTKLVSDQLGIGQTTVYRILKEIEEKNDVKR